MASLKQNYDFGKVDCELRLIRAVTSVADSFTDKKSKIKVKINDFATLILEPVTLMLEEGEISIVYKDIPGLPLTKTRVSLSEPLLPQLIVTDILSQLEKYENLRSVPQCSTCPAFLHNRTSDMCRQCELMVCAQQTPCSICTDKDKKIDVWVTTSCNHIFHARCWLSKLGTKYMSSKDVLWSLYRCPTCETLTDARVL
jgi:hypothetical protein